MHPKKWLAQLFFLSIGLNVVLFVLLFFFTVREHFFPRMISFSFKIPHHIEPLSKQHHAVVTLEKYELPQLIAALQEKSLLTPTVKVRDLALSLLVEKHHFAADEVLYEKILEKETLPSMVTFYSNLIDSDFKKLHHYALREKYPFSNKGLFLLLQQNRADPLLTAAFMNKEPFQLVKKLFRNATPPLDDKLLLELLMQGSWEVLDNFYSSQKNALHFSQGERRRFLKALLQEGAPLAPYVLLLVDYDGVLTNFDPDLHLLMVEMITKPTVLTKQFMKAMTVEGRPEALIKAARCKLQGEEKEVAGRFVERPSIGELRPAFRESAPKAPQPKQHVVQAGESLWILAKRYQISIEKIKEINHLRSDLLRPGQSLLIR